MSSPHVVRVALLERARIIEDRTLAPRQGVSVGTRGDNTVVTPLAAWPSKHQLISSTRAGFALHFTREMRGKVEVAGQELSLEELVSTGAAATDGQGFKVALTEKSRGRVGLGDTTVLFQFVPPRAPLPKLELPPEARGSLLGQVDRLFMVVLGLSLAVHFSGAVYAASQPMPESPELPVSEWADRFQKITLPAPPKPSPAVAKPTVAAVKPTPAKPNVEPVAKPPVEPAKLNGAVKKFGMLAVIGANGDGKEGVANMMNELTGGQSLEEAMKQAGGKLEVSAGGQFQGPHEGQQRRETIDLETKGVKQVTIGERGATQVKGRGSEGIIETTTTEIPPSELNAFIKARRNAFLSCYERELKRNPSLQGHLGLHFEITEQGRVAGVSFTDDTLRNTDVEECIRATVSRWITPFRPRSRSASPSRSCSRRKAVEGVAGWKNLPLTRLASARCVLGARHG